MKQSPAHLKFKKYFKLRSNFYKLIEKNNFYPTKAFYALKSLESGNITYKQIESVRITIRRTVKKKGDIYIKIFPYVSLTKKPLAMRMGKGKGNHYLWVSPIKKGQILFELEGYKEYQIKLALEKARHKLPIKVKVVKLVY